MELFLYGNPRLLSGGLECGSSGRESYENAPSLIAKGAKGHCTAQMEATCPIEPGRGYTGLDKAQSFGEKIHSGKGCYHSSISRNRFLVEGQYPTAGVEIETISSAYSGEHVRKLLDDLRSNWFHFERDGSLDDEHGGEYGFELITEPLPPRVYRNPDTWIGLENILSPWLESFDHSCTGLHVHVGLNQFQDFDSIPIANRTSRMYIGKVMAMLVYYFIADASFVDRVCLRKQTRFCRTPSDRLLFEGSHRLSSSGMTGYEFIDLAVGKLVAQNTGDWYRGVGSAISNPSTPPPFCQYSLSGTTEHGTEVNTQHKYTIEFRRGKGTLHSLSIHRMVELMTMIVRYAGKCCRCPEDIVSSSAFYEFVHDNTTSVPLKKLIESCMASK